MFKFIRQYAESMSNIDIYPVISLIIFVAFFSGMLWFVKRMRKESVHELSNLPLEDATETVLQHS